jgi:hypothetical protein
MELTRLNNLKNGLALVETGNSKSVIDFDKTGIATEAVKAYEMYIYPFANSILIAAFQDNESAELPQSVLANVTGATQEEPYNYVINALDTTANTLVYWSQISGSTSEYTIYHDVVKDCFNGLYEIPANIEADFDLSSVQYREVRNHRVYLPNFVMN